jgi:hypothetical protein
MRRALPLAGVPAAVAALSGWALAAAVLGLVVIVTGLCWVIADAGRSDRLALLITAARSHQRDSTPAELPEPSGRKPHDRLPR